MAPSIGFPLSGLATIETLDGSNWPTWSSRMITLFHMNGLKTHISDTKPASDKDWDAREEMVLDVLEMYCQKDIWMSVSDDSKFGTCKSKWEELQKLYGGIGSMSVFNSWMAITNAMLDDSTPLLPQLQKLNNLCITLSNNNNKITDLQYCFTLLKALPESYSTIASTIVIDLTNEESSSDDEEL